MKPVIGLDLGGTKIEAVALDASGEELIRTRLPTPRDSYEAVLETVAGLVTQVEASAGRAEPTLGIGTPGSISPFTGLVRNSNSMVLNGRPLLDDLRARLARPVVMANDADCFALSEWRDGAAAGAASVFGVIIGTGTGGGVVVGGRLLSGPNRIAGEWGHNPLPWPRSEELPGGPCYCGLAGCIETFVSGPGLARDHRESTRRDWDAPAVVDASRRGDAGALAAIDRYVDRLARSLASIINVLDPEVVVLGGGMSNVEELYQRVPAEWGRYVFSDGVATRIVRNLHGDSSGVRGAAWLAVEAAATA